MSRGEGSTRDIDMREYIQCELAVELKILIRKEDSCRHFDQDINKVGGIEQGCKSSLQVW